MTLRKMVFNKKNRAPELVAWYDFQSSAIDSTGKNNGTAVGSVAYVTGKVGNCINFGNNSNLNYVSISDNDKLSFVDKYGDAPFSISLWVNFQSISTGATSGNWLLNKRGASNNFDEWQLAYVNESSNVLQSLVFSKYSANSSNFQNIRLPFIPVLNTWYHIVFTDDGSKTYEGMKFYLNGVYQTISLNGSTGIYTGMINTNRAVLMGLPSWGLSSELKHRGSMDSVAIWRNKVLTTTEISQLYNSGNGISYPPPF